MARSLVGMLTFLSASTVLAHPAVQVQNDTPSFRKLMESTSSNFSPSAESQEGITPTFSRIHLDEEDIIFTQNAPRIHTDENSDNKIINLVSNQGDEFEVTLGAARLSTPIDDHYKDMDSNGIGEDDRVSFTNVNTQTLKKVVKFLEHFIEEPMRVINMDVIERPLTREGMINLFSQWYSDFVNVDLNGGLSVLFQLMGAAQDMGIKELLDLTKLEFEIKFKKRTTITIVKNYYRPN